MKVIDLFAGAGLFSYAFTQEGFSIIKAVEINEIACRSYIANMGNIIECNDVANAVMPGQCDVLIGGPPCQGFSTLGKRDGSDPRNYLCFEMVNWARKLVPSVVVIENVAAFIQSPIHGMMVGELSRLGYDVTAEIHNALDFGVPQIRKRSITIATKIGTIEMKPIPGKHPQTVREAFRGLPRDPTGTKLHTAPKPTKLAWARMNVIPYGGGKSDIMDVAPELAAESWWKIEDQASDVWGRMRWDKPANTLRTCLQNPSKGRYIHPILNRVITLREAARLHSIPDDYVFCGTPTQIARQIGNSVPVMLGRAIARAVMKKLTRIYSAAS